MEKEIPAVVPDFKLRPAPTETTKGQPNAKRVKRFITDLLSLGIQGFSAFYQNRKQNKLKKGMEKLFERQDILNNRVTKLDNDMISLARTTLLSLEHFQKELVRQGEHIKHLTNRVKHVEMVMQHHELKPTTRILAMGSNTQINLDYEQLVHCVKYNILFFCEQMFLEKQGNEHTRESAIYTNQNVKMIQQKCTIEDYPKLDPDILDAGNYLLLGNFPLPWNYFCKQKDEIPTPISASSYVIIKKCDLCQCSLSAGSWYLEANIANCAEDPDNPSTHLKL